MPFFEIKGLYVILNLGLLYIGENDLDYLVRAQLWWKVVFEMTLSIHEV